VGDISEHFSRSEFRCKCGCGQDTVDVELIELCEVVRDLNGNKPLVVTSGRVFHLLSRLYPESYGFGRYHSFIHVDTRTYGPARWAS